MRQKCYYIVLTVFFLFFITGKIYSQKSITAKVFAEVIEAISANEDEALNFGRFSPGNTESEIVISPKGLRSVEGTAVTITGDYSAGSFTVLGASDASFTIKLPDNPAVLTHEKSGNTMQVKDWISTPSMEEEGVLVEGSCNINIGATLVVGTLDENPVGVYSGTYTLTFAYN